LYKGGTRTGYIILPLHHSLKVRLQFIERVGRANRMGIVAGFNVCEKIRTKRLPLVTRAGMPREEQACYHG